MPAARLGLTLCAAALALPGAAAAQDAPDPLEGVWQREGSTTGKAGKHVRQADGSIEGFQVRGSATCSVDATGRPDLVGLRAFTVRAQPDGTYTGVGYGYDTGCSFVREIPVAIKVFEAGPTTWRLRQCAGVDGAPPRYDADFNALDAGTNCVSDVRLEAPAAPARPADAFTLPRATRRCRSRRSFSIRLRHPAQDPLVSATVKVNGRTVATQQGERTTARVDLRGLPKGRYRVRIAAVTATGRQLKETRRYRTCAPRRR